MLDILYFSSTDSSKPIAGIFPETTMWLSQCGGSVFTKDHRSSYSCNGKTLFTINALIVAAANIIQSPM